MVCCYLTFTMQTTHALPSTMQGNVNNLIFWLHPRIQSIYLTQLGSNYYLHHGCAWTIPQLLYSYWDITTVPKPAVQNV